MGLHNWTGVLIMFLTITVCLQGTIALATRIFVTWDDQKLRLSRAIHKYLGIASFLFATYVNALGFIRWCPK
jgi:hypothetical protein